MGVHINEMERVDLLISLVHSLNRGNSCHYKDRVSMAEEQLEQILNAVEKINTEYKGAFR